MNLKIMKSWSFLWLVLLAVSCEVCAWSCTSSSFRHYCRGCNCKLTATYSDEAERLKESASKLREEAEALREQLVGQSKQKQKRKEGEKDTPATTTIPAIYKQLPGSCWMFTYRFASEPEAEDDDKKENVSPTTPRTMYSGKLALKFLDDGYTDILSHEPTSSPALEIEKAWGWDEETSNEDNLQYVLFSTNAKLSDQDTSMPGHQLQRFYWQAQIDTDKSTKTISLTDGTVTVKKDVKPPGGFWGVFDGGGILAQFRSVGNFIGKPIAETQ